MTLVDTGAQLLRITEVTREEVLKEFTPDSCIASTRALIRVLHYFGHASKPLPVSLRVFNAAGWLWAQKEVPVSDWPSGAWSVGVAGSGTFPGQKRWDGHLVAMTVDQRFMLDPSLDQVARPAYGLDMHPSIFGFADLWPEDSTIRFDRDDGVVIMYRRLDNPGRWWQSPDWQKGAAIRRVIGRSIRRLRSEGSNEE